MPIRHPTEPSGHQFEEAVAARIRSIGYFTECRTIFDYEGRAVLELDAVASPASEKFLNRILIDAKKEKASFADIFKIFGWRTFLNISSGCMVHGVGTDVSEVSALEHICPKLNVYANHYDVKSATPLNAIPQINCSADKNLVEAAAHVGWYQQIADRLALENFYQIRKQNLDKDIISKAREYRRACHLAFFERDPLKRVELLYDAFKDEAGISGKCCGWAAFKDSKELKMVEDGVRDSENYMWIQHVMSLETRARILIIKNAIEAILSGISNVEYLPENFQNGFSQAINSSNKAKLPYILQLYTEIFGAFYLDETDILQLASLADAPKEAIPEALELLNVFFPTTNGWQTKSKEIQMMKWIPAYLRGIGAFFRQKSRGIQDYNSIAPNMGWLLKKWHNAAYLLLEKELKVREVEAK